MDKYWTIFQETFAQENLHHKDTIFTIGNGYLSTRGKSIGNLHPVLEPE
jgi:trehalose/maltose hydrolase-like predicted phosphorylase